MIQTVLGPVEAGGARLVSMHEHLLTDASALQRPGVEALDPGRPGHRRARGRPALEPARARRQPPPRRRRAARRRAGVGARAGLAAVSTSARSASGPTMRACPSLSAEAGVAIVAGYGAYLPRLLPEWYLALDVDGRTALFTGR